MAEANKKELSPRKQPRQQRSRATIDRIFAATRKLLAEEGPASFSTRRVAAASGVNISSIYQYFPNKQAILYAMYQERLGEVMAIFDALQQPEQLEADPETFFHRLFDEMDALQWYSEEDTALEKAIAHDGKLNEISEAHRKRVVERLVGLLRHFGSSWTNRKLTCLGEYLYALDIAATELMPRKSKAERKQISSWSREASMRLIQNCLKED